MKSLKNWQTSIRAGALDAAFARLYPGAKAATCRRRYLALLAFYRAQFGETDAAALVSAPGRTEIGGNHTDHENGKVLASAVDLDMLALVSPDGSDTVTLASEGFGTISVSLKTLVPCENEKNTTAALVRGMAASLAQDGVTLRGGKLAVTSAVPPGSGLSSSAAFEMLLGTALCALAGVRAPEPAKLARMGREAENRFFGKPCGLMDQSACVVGGVCAMDFCDPDAPKIRSVPFPENDYVLCLVSAGGHADLTADYAAIPREMKAVAASFGKTVLREVPEKEFYARLPALRAALGDRAVLRAMHFYRDEGYVDDEVAALRKNDFPAFLAGIRASGRSSLLCLQNIWNDELIQPLTVALAVCEDAAGPDGAVRVHGGGFGGTVMAWVPASRAAAFKKRVEVLLGPDTCRAVRLRPVGTLEIGGTI